jgi:hypothetical protein
MGLSVSRSPIFWVYVPYKSEQVRTGEFVLQDEQGKRDIFRGNIKLSGTPGIIRISLPRGLNLLEEYDRPYRWSLIVYCSPDNTDANTFVRGYIQRVSGEAGLKDYSYYTKRKIWHDALTILANERLRHPQKSSLNTEWKRLLGAAGLESIADESLVDCCTME